MRVGLLDTSLDSDNDGLPEIAVSGADMSRTFSWVRTTDRRQVQAAADALLHRVPSTA